MTPPQLRNCPAAFITAPMLRHPTEPRTAGPAGPQSVFNIARSGDPITPYEAGTP